jgi:hypothetical protein
MDNKKIFSIRKMWMSQKGISKENKDTNYRNYRYNRAVYNDDI